MKKSPIIIINISFEHLQNLIQNFLGKLIKFHQAFFYLS
jgi:hypothetical protein